MKKDGETIGNRYIIRVGPNDEVVTSVTNAINSLTIVIMCRASLNKQYRLQQHFEEHANSH